MKFLTPQLTYLLTQRESRQNLRSLLRYLAFLAATIASYSLLFHPLMLYEGQQHSLLTGVYWTLTVMSTLGFGDITFQADAGRIFSIVVLLSGILLLLVLLPFAFIRLFYAPWLEAQLRLRAPREIASDERDHVIICRFDDLARGLIERLAEQEISCFVIEPDPARAAAFHAEGLPVVMGDVDASATYAALRTSAARLVVANLDDATNTNITLTVRENYPKVPVAALAEDKDSVDVLELSGATSVLPLKHRLGEHLAWRVTVGTTQAHPVGRYKDLVIAEFPVHDTPLVGRSVADTRLRQLTGLNLVAYSERGRLRPARADTVLSANSVAVVVGTEDQIATLDALFVIYEPNENPVLVIGGGKVGRAVARALKKRDIAVHILDRDSSLVPTLAQIADRVFSGDAADLDVVTKAGVAQTPSVVLTTNDDSINAFLAIYCRRLNPQARIVSRITHERNLEAIYRAGSDFVLSYATLGVTSLLSIVHDRELVLAGEGVDLFVESVHAALAGKTLGESGIAAETGLNVVAVQKFDGPALNPTSAMVLEAGSELVMLGTGEQRAHFRRRFASKSH